MLNKKLLMSAQQSVCAGLLGEKVKVVFDATVPCADLKNRIMHLRPMPDKINDTDILHLRADCDHEMGHFGVSDVNVFGDIKNPLHQLLMNSIEDGFIERWVTERWFGCGENLRKSNAKLYKEMRAEATGDEDCVKRRSISALQLIAFGHEMPFIYKTLGDDIALMLAQVEDLFPELRAITNSHESLRLAEEVDKRWAWTKPESKTKDGEGESKEGSTGGAAISSGSSTKKDKTEKKEKKDDEKETKDEDKKDAPTPDDQEDGDEDEKKAQDEKEKEDSRPDAATLAAILSKDSIDIRRKEKVASTKFEAARYFACTDDDTVRLLRVDAPPEYTSLFIDSVRAIVPPLRRRLLMEFRGVGTKREFDKKRGEIDRESLHKVAVGNTRIFTLDTPHAVPDADVTLLIDASGSMMNLTESGKTRLHLASQAAAAFSSVLDLIGVSNECLAFTTHNEGEHRWMKKHRDHGGPYSRVRPLRHMIIKRSDESFRNTRKRFASLSLFEQCSENVDGESVMWAARRLAARNRHGMSPVLLVFSDGQPASQPESFSLLNWHLKQTVERIEKAGIHVIGVGIASTSVERFFTNHIVLRDLSDLVGTSYRILSEVLKKARRVG